MQNIELEKLKGEVYALRTICFALIASHPDKPTLLPALERMTEQTLANALQTTLSEPALQVAQDLLERALAPARRAGA